MSEEAKELFDKLIDQVDGVSIQWTSHKSFRVIDLINNETREFQIEEVK